jgi:spermidine/putrescine transport system substrate-binding protein
MTDQRVPDPSLLRGHTMPRVSRRDLFRYAGMGAGAMGLSSVLAACGVKGEVSTSASASPGAPGTADWWNQQKQQDVKGSMVNFTNWPQYIDIGKDAQGNRIYPSIEAFTKATGINVTYRADINSNEEYYAQIRPALEGGQSTGADIMVITNGQILNEIMSRALDPDLHPNFDQNAGTTVKDPAYDPGNKYTMAWQSGFTGVAYNKKYVSNVSSLQDLLDPKYSGKIGMFGDNADLPNMALLAVGVTPETSTQDDWQKAADWLQKQKDSGVVRNYYTQTYLTALENEDIYITMAWSGDILIDQLYYGYDNLEFYLPSEGALIWTDNMCIPQQAANPVGAEMLMDWYYKPDIAAALTEYNNYVGPVPAAQAIVKSDAAKATGNDKTVLDSVANSPLVFPTDAIAQQVHRYRVLTPDEETTWNSLFGPIWQS